MSDSKISPSTADSRVEVEDDGRVALFETFKSILILHVGTQEYLQTLPRFQP